MSKVLRFPCHARASSKTADLDAARPAKTSSVTPELPRSAASATTAAQWAAGMPLVCQPLTVDADCPSAGATIPVPPKAAMIDFQSYMERNIVRDLRTCQEFAECETTSINKRDELVPMDDSDKAVGKRLIALRSELGMQQQEFAKSIKIAKNTLAGYETGARSITMETARRIRRRYGVTVDWILFGEMKVSGHNVMLRLGPEPDVTVILPRRVRRNGNNHTK